MKKFYSLVALLALLTSFLLSFGAVSAATFPDVKTENKNFIAIEYLVNIGTLKGYDDGTFKPSATVNRAELMKVLVAGQGIDPDDSKYQNCFPDVTTDWYAEFVCYGKEKGWVSGYPDGTFQPAKEVNRVEAIKMSINALGFGDWVEATVTESLYSDTDSSQWYAPYLKVAKNLNLVEESSGYFHPTDGMMRSTISENIFRSLVSKEYENVPYIEDHRDEFLVNEDMEDLLEESGEAEDDDEYTYDEDDYDENDEEDDDSDDSDANELAFTTELLPAFDEVTTEGSGIGSFIMYEHQLEYYLTVENFYKDITAAHFHNVGTGDVEETITFEGDAESGIWGAEGYWTDLTEEQEDALLSGFIYVNIHTDEYPDGELAGYLEAIVAEEESDEYEYDYEDEGEDEDESDDDKVMEQEDKDVDMEVGDFFFNPSTIVAAPGQTVNVTFTAVEGTHTFAIDEIDLEESVEDQGTITFTVPEEEGEYAFYCSVGSHRSMGMEGTLIVQE